MSHRTRPRTLWSIALAFATFAALFATIGSSPAAAQAGPVITDPGLQRHDVGHRACTSLEVSAPVDSISVRGDFPPGAALDIDPNRPARLRLGGTPNQVGNYRFEVRAESDALGDGPWRTIDYQVYAPDASVPIIKAGRLSQAFTIDCFSQGAPANEFLSDPDNFGPNGTVRIAGLAIHEHTDGFDGRPTRITAEYLADADILFDGFVSENSYSRGELRIIRRWVERDGGVLIAAEDNQFSDRLGEIFGAPTEGFDIPADDTDPNGDPWRHCGNPGEIPNQDDIDGQPTCPRLRPAGSGSHPIVRGPFDSWSRIWTDGTVGYLAPGFDRAWKRVATHPNGRAAIIERKVGNGHVIILSDEGTVRTNLDGDNGVFLGNLFAFAIDQVSEVPRAKNDVFSGRVFDRFSANICRNDDTGDGRTRVSITRGSLPPDLRLRGCRITGNPGTSSFGTFGATYQIRDADGDTDTGKIQITLNSSFNGSGAGSNPRCNGRPATIVGTSGADVIRGTAGNDVIVARGGKDVIRGRGGNDIICGGGGGDRIIGGPGRDTCFGEKGRDRIRGCETRRP